VRRDWTEAASLFSATSQAKEAVAIKVGTRTQSQDIAVTSAP